MNEKDIIALLIHLRVKICMYEVNSCTYSFLAVLPPCKKNHQNKLIAGTFGEAIAGTESGN